MIETRMYTIQQFVSTLGGYITIIHTTALCFASLFLFPVLTQHIIDLIKKNGVEGDENNQDKVLT